MKILISWLVLAIVVFIAAYILPGIVLSDIVAALVAAFVLGLLNAFLKPILIFLTLPINIITLGLFTLVINAGIVMLVAFIVPGFDVVNFWWALLFSVIVSIANAFLGKSFE